MATDVLMPNLGFDTQTSRLVEWLKEPGSVVEKGQAIAVIESDKANIELEAIVSGVLLEHCVDADQEVAVGSVIARIGSAEEYRSMRVAPKTVKIGGSPQAQDVPALGATGSTSRVSPVAQRLARDLQIDVSQITGSGVRGRITRSDVQQAYQSQQTLASPPSDPLADAKGVRALPAVRRAARQRGIDLTAVLAAGYTNPITLATLDAYAVGSQPPTPIRATTRIVSSSPSDEEGVTVVSLSRTRQIIGKRLGESMREAPHFYVTGEFIFDAALARIKTLPGKVKINDLILYLTAQTLMRLPALNATFYEGVLRQYQSVHLAIAVARDDGLITPVLHHAERYSLAGIAEASRTLIERARANRLSLDDLQNGTFTVSNLGMVQQVEHFTAVINPPQVGILAVGALKPRPVVIDGGLFVRHTARLTLSGDHRVVDGMDLAQFMAVFEEELNRFAPIENP